MEDPRAEPPEPKMTAKIEKVDIVSAQLTQLLTTMREGFAGTEEHFTRQDVMLADQKKAIQNLADSDVSASARMAKFEIRLDGHDTVLGSIKERLENNSMRAKAVSLHDGEQDEKLSTIDKAILDTQAMMKEQNKLFGIDKKTVIEWVRGPNAKRDLATIAILLASLYTTFRESIGHH